MENTKELKTLLENHLNDYIIVRYPTDKEVKGFGSDLLEELIDELDIWTDCCIDSDCDYCDYIISL